MPQGQVSAQAEPQASVDDVGDPAVQRYTPYGETRGSETVDVPYQFTGQRNEASIGLYHYGARWYDPALGRFIQADTIVPQPEDPQSLNRYSYVLNNPLKHTDPSGRWVETALDIAGIAFDIYQIRQDGWTTVNTVSLVVDVGCLLLPVAAGGGMLVRAATKVDDVGDAVRVANATDSARAANVVGNTAEVAERGLKEVGEETIEQSFRSFIRSNFRENLARLTGRAKADIVGLEAHHVLPQKFEAAFRASGIESIHDPRFGAWVNVEAHHKWSWAYGQQWKRFLYDVNGNPISYTPEQILKFAETLAKEYQFDVNFTR